MQMVVSMCSDYPLPLGDRPTISCVGRGRRERVSMKMGVEESKIADVEGNDVDGMRFWISHV